MKKRIYLDNNATTPIDPAVLTVLTDTYQHYFGNPSSIHSFGQEAKQLLTRYRRDIASYFGVRPSELLFTSSGTEAINLVIKGLFGPNPSGHLITSNVEHSAVYQTTQALQSQGCRVTYLEAGMHGAVSCEAVREALCSDTRLIVLIGVNNETGVKTDVEAVALLAQEKGIPLFIDGVAWIGKESFRIPSGVSAIAFSAHKFHGPKGMGVAIVRSGIKLYPLIHGGGQEEDRRSGTENLPGIAGMSCAIALLKEGLPHYVSKMRSLRDRFEAGILANIQSVLINGDGERICNVSNLAFEGVDGELLLMQLDMEGIAASHGSACSSGALEPSRVLLNMGMSTARAAGSLRFSFSRYNTEDEVDRAVEVITQLLKS